MEIIDFYFKRQVSEKLRKLLWITFRESKPFIVVITYSYNSCNFVAKNCIRKTSEKLTKVLGTTFRKCKPVTVVIVYSCNYNNINNHKQRDD